MSIELKDQPGSAVEQAGLEGQDIMEEAMAPGGIHGHPEDRPAAPPDEDYPHNSQVEPQLGE